MGAEPGATGFAWAPSPKHIPRILTASLHCTAPQPQPSCFSQRLPQSLCGDQWAVLTIGMQAEEREIGNTDKEALAMQSSFAYDHTHSPRGPPNLKLVFAYCVPDPISQLMLGSPAGNGWSWSRSWWTPRMREHQEQRASSTQRLLLQTPWPFSPLANWFIGTMSHARD